MCDFSWRYILPQPALLALEDGQLFWGQSIGSDGDTVGEVVWQQNLSTGVQQINTSNLAVGIYTLTLKTTTKTITEKQMGYTTNIDLKKLSEIVLFCENQLNAPLGGRMSAWLNRENKTS